jgi:hypothetical protein
MKIDGRQAKCLVSTITRAREAVTPLVHTLIRLGSGSDRARRRRSRAEHRVISVFDLGVVANPPRKPADRSILVMRDNRQSCAYGAHQGRLVVDYYQKAMLQTAWRMGAKSAVL